MTGFPSQYDESERCAAALTPQPTSPTPPQSYPSGQSHFQVCGNTGLAAISPGQFPANTTRRVGVIAQVHGVQNCLLERIRLIKCPQRCFQAFDNPSRSDNCWWLPIMKVPLADFFNQRMKRLLI